MTGNQALYKVVKWQKYEVTRSKLIKAHYRRNKKAGHEFESLIDDFVESLAFDPRPSTSPCEPYPAANCLPVDCEFRKMRWRNLPSLQGCAKYGRLLYLVFEQEKLVYPFWLYTHKEYSKPNSRPPAEEILKEIKKIINHVKENFG